MGTVMERVGAGSLCHSDGQNSSVSGAGASFGANNSSFKLLQERFSQRQKSTVWRSSPIASLFFTTRLCTELVRARVLGCLFLSELSRCADTGLFFSPLPLLLLICRVWFTHLPRLALESKQREF